MIVIRKQRISSIIATFCILDILMFPYVRALSCSLSMITIALWYFFHIRSIPSKNSMYIILPLIIVSVIWGYLVYNSTYGISTTVVVIFSLMFFYYIYWNYNDSFKEVLSRILFFYITFVLVLGIIYAISAQMYFSIRAFWSFNNNVIEFNSYTLNRFNFIYSDPNNAGCAFAAIYCYVMICENHKMWKYIYYTIAISICVLLTMSVQAIAVFVAVCLTFFFLKEKKYTIGKSAILIVVGAELVLLFCIGNGLLEGIPLVDKILKRISSNEVSTFGGRVNFWIDTISNALSLENIFIGKGSIIDSAGNRFIPHSGILYMTISYGFIVNVAYFITVFLLPRRSKFKYYIVLLPFLVIYVINTGVSDYRFMTTMALLSAVVHRQAMCDFS